MPAHPQKIAPSYHWNISFISTKLAEHPKQCGEIIEPSPLPSPLFTPPFSRAAAGVSSRHPTPGRLAEAWPSSACSPKESGGITPPARPIVLWRGTSTRCGRPSVSGKGGGSHDTSKGRVVGRKALLTGL